MQSGWVIEAVGYLGSALVVVSMLMTSVVRLCVVNTMGSLIFMCYALIIGSYPTALMNFFLIVINLYQLLRLLRSHKHYDLIDSDLKDAFLSYLLGEYQEDIRNWFPSFSAEGIEADVALIVCCDSRPAGLFLGRSSKPGEIDILRTIPILPTGILPPAVFCTDS